MQNQRIIFLSITILSFLLGQEEHDHHDEHGHHKELSIAFGITPKHENENNKLGVHIHYIKGLGNHSPYAFGLYRFESGYSIAYVPGLLFADEENAMQFTQHLEFCYEFEYKQYHIGPQFDIGIEGKESHYSVGIHLGIDF